MAACTLTSTFTSLYSHMGTEHSWLERMFLFLSFSPHTLIACVHVCVWVCMCVCNHHFNTHLSTCATRYGSVTFIYLSRISGRHRYVRPFRHRRFNDARANDALKHWASSCLCHHSPTGGSLRRASESS